MLRNVATGVTAIAVVISSARADSPVPPSEKPIVLVPVAAPSAEQPTTKISHSAMVVLGRPVAARTIR